MADWAWVNGHLVDAEQPALLVNDHGFTVGDGLFETLSVRSGQPFALTRHLRRLLAAADRLGLRLPDAAELRRAVGETLGAHPVMEFGRVRITVSAGPAPLGSARGEAPATVVVQASAQSRPPATAVVVSAPWPRNERGPLAGLKATSYAENVLVLDYAKARGADDALVANTRGELCEGALSNVFVAVAGELLTPPLSAGPLPGVSRELLLEWGSEHGLPVREAVLPFEVLASADEVLITSSMRDVQPVRSMDGRDLPAPGPLGRRAIELFAAQAAVDVDP